MNKQHPYTGNLTLSINCRDTTILERFAWETHVSRYRSKYI